MDINSYAFIHTSGRARLACHLESLGHRIWEIDMLSVKGAPDFIQAARRALPQDPPLVQGRNFDALIDSVVGGLDSVSETSKTKKFAVFLIHADKVLEENPELLVNICVVFSDIANSLTQCFDVGEELTLATFLLGEGHAFRMI